jgi:hypothetical protein
MTAREGNVLKVPGHTTKTEVKGDEILGGYAQGITQKGLTIKAGSGVLEAGTLLKVSSTAKKYEGVAAAAGISGTVGILRKGVDASGATDVLANYVGGGNVKVSALKYADGTSVGASDLAAVATALKGRIDAIHGYLIF